MGLSSICIYAFKCLTLIPVVHGIHCWKLFLFSISCTWCSLTFSERNQWIHWDELCPSDLVSSEILKEISITSTTFMFSDWHLLLSDFLLFTENTLLKIRKFLFFSASFTLWVTALFPISGHSARFAQNRCDKRMIVRCSNYFLRPAYSKNALSFFMCSCFSISTIFVHAKHWKSRRSFELQPQDSLSISNPKQ